MRPLVPGGMAAEDAGATTATAAVSNAITTSFRMISPFGRLITTPTEARRRRQGRQRGQQQSFVRANPGICVRLVTAVHDAVALKAFADVSSNAAVARRADAASAINPEPACLRRLRARSPSPRRLRPRCSRASDADALRRAAV